MRGWCGAVVSVAGFLFVGALASGMVSQYLDRQGTFVVRSKGEAATAVATLNRMRTLIHLLQTR